MQQKDLKSYLDTEGMTSLFSLHVIDALLQFQNELNINGDLVEFGVYKGRVANFLVSHLGKNEKIILIDYNDHGVGEKLLNSSIDVIQWITNSQSFLLKLVSLLNYGHSRFIHIDGSHEFKETKSEISTAKIQLSKKGIISIDDFENDHYPQVIAATYSKILSFFSNYRLFLISDKKAYICHKKMLKTYGNFSLDTLPQHLATLGFNITLSKTDYNKKINTISLKYDQNSNIGKVNLYGEYLYANFLINFTPDIKTRMIHFFKRYILLKNIYKFFVK